MRRALMLLCWLAAAAAGPAGQVRAEPLPGAVAAEIVVSQRTTGIVSQGPSTIVLAPGYVLQTERRGDNAVVGITTSDRTAGKGYVNCTCSSNGACWPKTSNNQITCLPTLSPGCDGSCSITLTAPPPPPPNP